MKVAIVGTAQSSRMLAPYADASWEIWACSPGNLVFSNPTRCVLPRVNAWFELHQGGDIDNPAEREWSAPYLNFLQMGGDFKVYMQDNGRVPRALTFPKDELVAEFGSFCFTSSFAWMFALAMHQGATAIGIFGVDMATKEEYLLQKPILHHLMKVANDRGIQVMAPYESCIMQPLPLYGYSLSTPFGKKVRTRMAELEGRLSAAEQHKAKLEYEIGFLRGALEDCKYFETIWTGDGVDRFMGSKARTLLGGPSAADSGGGMSNVTPLKRAEGSQGVVA